MTLARKLEARFNALEKRERWLVFGCGITLIMGVAFALFIDPSLTRIKSIDTAIGERRHELSILRTSQADLTARLDVDINAPVRDELDKTRTQVTEVDKEVAELHRSLIPAGSMANVLSEMLRSGNAVKLISLKNLPPETILSAEDVTDKRPIVNKPGEGPHGLVYRHGIDLVIEGSYFDLLTYVADLEQQKWRVLWSTTKLTAHYPVSRLELRLYTVSLDETWLSV